MVSYVLEVSLYWGIFSLIFHLFLRKLTFFTFNRYYLIISLVIGLILPLISFNIQQPAPAVEETIYFLAPISNSPAMVEASLETQSAGIPYKKIFLWIYWTGVVVFGVQFLIGLNKIFQLYLTGNKIKKNDFTLVQTRRLHLPFSFFNMVFWSKELKAVEEGDDKIMLHELSHVRDRHSYDVLLIEVIRIFLWCSPFIYWYKRSMRQVHEYIADHTVLRTTQLKSYGHLLLKQSQSGMQLALANHFIHSQLKNRITMMLQKPSGRMAKLKYLLILPVILGLGLLISAKSFDQDQTYQVEGFNENKEHPFYTLYADEIKLTEGEDYLIANGNVKVINEELLISSTPIEVAYKSEDQEYKKQLNAKIPGLLSIKKEDGEIVALFRIFEYEGGLKKFMADQVVIASEDIVSVNVSKNGEGEMAAKYATLQPDQLLEIVIRQDAKLEFITDLGLSYEEDDQQGNQLVYDVYQDNIEIKKIDFEIIDRNHKLIEGSKSMFGYKALAGPSSNELTKIETMPRFPGCNDLDSESDKSACSKKRLIEFIYTNIRYPKASREAGIEGKNVVQFIVETDGSISNIQLVKSIDQKTGAEAKRIVELMAALPEKWTPAFTDGKPVRSTFNLPINFKLEGKDEPQAPRYLFILFDKEGNTYGHYNKSMIENLPKKDVLSVNVMKGEDALKKYPKTSNLETVTEIHMNWGKEDFFMHGLSISELTVVGYGKKEPKRTNDPIFKQVDQMPRFPGCEGIEGTMTDKEDCAKKQMLEFIYSNIRYPSEAKEKGVQGMCVIRFVIEKDGSISNAEVVRDIGAGCGDESLKVVKMMNEMDQKWMPGFQQGQAVRVQYNLPIRFMLEDEQPVKKQSHPILLVFDKNAELIREYKQSAEILNDIRPDDIKSISVLKDKSLAEKYPDKVNSDGLVEIYLKISKTKYLKKVEKSLKSEVQTNESMSKDLKEALESVEKTNPGNASALDLHEFRAFPNPSKDILNVSFTTDPGTLKWSIIDATGKEIFADELTSFGGVFNKSVNLRDAVKGATILTFEQNGKQYIHKVMIQ